MKFPLNIPVSSVDLQSSTLPESLGSAVRVKCLCKNLIYLVFSNIPVLAVCVISSSFFKILDSANLYFCCFFHKN